MFLNKKSIVFMWLSGSGSCDKNVGFNHTTVCCVVIKHILMQRILILYNLMQRILIQPPPSLCCAFSLCSGRLIMVLKKRGRNRLLMQIRTIIHSVILSLGSSYRVLSQQLPQRKLLVTIIGGSSYITGKKVSDISSRMWKWKENTQKSNYWR